MTATTQEISATEFLRRLADLTCLYGRLLELTRAQCESADAYGDIAGVLESKRALMRQIDAVGLDVATLRERWNEARESLPEERRAEAGELIRLLQSTLRDLIEAENRWHDGVASKKEETLSQIRKLQGGGKILRAYGKPAREVGPRFLDKTE